MSRAGSPALVLGVAILLAGCDPSPATPTPAPSGTTHVAAGGPQSRAPVPSGGVLPGPYAVVATNVIRQGPTYQVLLITTDARIAAQVAVTSAPIQINQVQTQRLPRVSATSSRVYFLDGATELRWLAPDGSTGTVRSIAAGAGTDLAFAVSPDEQRVAVTVVSQGPSGDIIATTYVENLRDGSARVQLSQSRGLDDFHWVVGWHGAAVVEGHSGSSCFVYVGGGAPCGPSYRVVSASTGAVLATICGPPATPAAEPSRTGLPVAAGITCELVNPPPTTSNGTSSAGLPTGDITAASWTDTRRLFVSAADPAHGLAVDGCFLAPDGGQMACTSNTTQAVTFLAPGGALRDLGAGYRILGWLDTGHLLVAVDVQTLGVVAVDRGSTRLLTHGETDTMELAGTMPPTL